MSTSARFASDRNALGICDRCGFSFMLKDLHYEIEDQRLNGLRVCSVCLDEDHPQLQLGEIIISDPEALYDPRPDVNIPGSTGYFGWRPIGHPITNTTTGSVGTLSISVA